MLGIKSESFGSDIDERFAGRPEDPKELVLTLSRLKAESVAANFTGGIIIGLDSVGYFNRNILEKPKSREESFTRLKAFSGNSLQFFTGIYLINLDNGEKLNKAVETSVNVRELTEAEINKYLDQDPKYSTYALGFDPLGHYSSTFVTRLEGSYNNFLRGIPLETIVEMLIESGYKI